VFGAATRARIARDLALAVSALLHALAPGQVLAAADPFPAVAAAYVVEVDGTLHFAHAADVRRAPASLTKLLTALVLLDSKFDTERVLIVSARAAAMPGARLGLVAGDRLRAGDALAAMLVASANDACMALVEDTAPSMAQFARRMNAHAARLGMRRSHFEHPCGFDHPRQHATARDLLRLAHAVLAAPLLRELAALPGAQVDTLDGRSLRFTSTNALLGRIDGAVGLKTGATARAGDCLIAVVRRGPHTVVAVLLGARERWFGAAALVDRAFADASGR
jgi:serine-type D-Ala-D-Ala carboxypeptidase (penicillin-binding protein 5/6)